MHTTQTLSFSLLPHPVQMKARPLPSWCGAENSYHGPFTLLRKVPVHVHNPDRDQRRVRHVSPLLLLCRLYCCNTDVVQRLNADRVGFSAPRAFTTIETSPVPRLLSASSECQMPPSHLTHPTSRARSLASAHKVKNTQIHAHTGLSFSSSDLLPGVCGSPLDTQTHRLSPSDDRDRRHERPVQGTSPGQGQG